MIEVKQYDLRPQRVNALRFKTGMTSAEICEALDRPGTLVDVTCPVTGKVHVCRLGCEYLYVLADGDYLYAEVGGEKLTALKPKCFADHYAEIQTA